MKICILFRGEIERGEITSVNSRGSKNPCFLRFSMRGVMDSRLSPHSTYAPNLPEKTHCGGISNPCIHYTNWQKTIFTDLSNSEHDFDIIFITYPCNSIDILKDKLQPKEVILLPYENSSQLNTFSKTNDYIQTHQSEYDRFIILRFDIIYKLNITKWNHWNSINIIIPNKDITWVKTKFYNDIVFIIDKTRIDDFNKAVQYMLSIDNTPIKKRFCSHMGMPHHIGQYLHIHHIPFELMYDTILEGTKNHPLYIFTRYYDYNDSTYL